MSVAYLRVLRENKLPACFCVSAGDCYLELSTYISKGPLNHINNYESRKQLFFDGFVLIFLTQS